MGTLKTAIREAILDGVIPNEREAALAFLHARAAEIGLKPADDADQTVSIPDAGAS